MIEAILQTKLHRPILRSNLVPRPRLIDKLNAGLGGKLNLICASAGYGKTTLVAGWLQDVKVQSTWLSLDESDNDPRRFLGYLLAALRQVQADIGRPVEAMLQSPQPPPNDGILTALVNEIAIISQPFILVLDDYHVIHTPSIHQQVNFLLEHQPSQLCLVIITREDPPLSLSRLRARGQLTETRQEDLRFSPKECADFLQGVMGLNLSVGEVAVLERRTEGWIVGLQLAALSMRGHADISGFIQAFTGSSRFILDYLMEEVFERQSSEVKDFLLKTSILERICSPLCDAVTSDQSPALRHVEGAATSEEGAGLPIPDHQSLFTSSQAILEFLEHSNLFIIPLDQARQWYRYHSLFAELLRHRLRLFHPDLQCELHKRASQWFETEGWIAEAIQHALAAQDWSRAGNLIHNVSADFLEHGKALTLIGWYQHMPREIVLADPKLCFDYCWALLLSTQYDLAAPMLEHVEQAAKDMPVFLGEVFAAQAYLARGQGEHALMVEKSQQALALLPKSSVRSRGIVALNLGLAYWHMGQMQAAEEALAEALEAEQDAGNPYAALTALIFQGRVFAVRGQLKRAAEYFERTIQEGHDMPINALAYMDLATLHYEWNALDVSDEHIQKAIALCQRSQNDEFLVSSLMLQSRLRIAQGNLAGAEDALAKAWELVRGGKIPAPTSVRLDSAQVYWLWAKGELKEEWGRKLTERVDCHPFYRFLGVTKVHTLPEAPARAYLHALSKVAQANDWVYGLVAIRVLQSTLAEQQEEALELLIEALRLAKSEGYIRSFAEAGKKIVPLLREAARRGVSPDYVGEILSVMTDRTESRELARRSLVEPLSERELEVLWLMVAGLSNREIAEKLVISTGTAKTHVHNLCGKLGVRNRTEAAARAKDLHLV